MKLVSESLDEAIKHLKPREESEIYPEIVKKILNILNKKNIKYNIKIQSQDLYFIETKQFKITLSIDKNIKWRWYGFYELNNKETLIYNTKKQDEIFQYIENYLKTL